MRAAIEKRGLTVETRTKGRKLEGYAALFNSPADMGGGYSESISAGAFTASLAAQADILALVDHDPSKMLARTSSGSLRLSEDARGLAFELDVPKTQAGQDVLALAERGDLGGMSFGFIASDEMSDGQHRELRAVDLIEISVVQSWPAYSGTTVEARSFPKPSLAYAQRVLKLWEASL